MSIQLYNFPRLIDDQHRLYWYATSEYQSKNTIPVVAFVTFWRSQKKMAELICVELLERIRNLCRPIALKVYKEFFHV